MKNWKVLYVKSNYELKIEQQLKQLGIEHYLPKVQVIRTWSDRIKKMLVPAFPSYLFVHISDKVRSKVFKAKGVLRFVRHENQDAIIKEEELDLIRNSQSALLPKSLQTIQKLKGRMILIKDGLLAGKRGLLVDFIGKKFVQLHLETIAMGFLVKLPVEQLQLQLD
ncbi:MAG TPA: UpxY family transcription antiterminator [Bacteroidia bacterium]|nr:UpxY family transcription antiterminator [Bacteroidia bacterium]